MTSPTDRPTVKLKPGKSAGRAGLVAPWIYADQIAMDRRTRALEPGRIVRLVAGERVLGTAAFNAESQIAARLLDPDPEAEIGSEWLAARISRALALRTRLYGDDFYRLVHAEGDGLPGLIVDRFGTALAVQPNSAWIDGLTGPLVEALMAVTGAETAVVNGASRGRGLEGLAERHEMIGVPLSGPVEVAMNGVRYLADLETGQKTGLFYDQRPNHAFAARLAGGGRVLDVFTHVGGFALAALAGGAGEALAIDSSAPALALAEEGARRSGLAARFATERGDAFDALARLGAAGERFDLVICDPPAFAPRKAALAQGLRAYERLARLAAPLVAPGGWLMLCSCSHAAGPEAFHQANVAGMTRAGRAGALVWSGRAGPDHPSHAALPETSYLKALGYRLDG